MGLDVSSHVILGVEVERFRKAITKTKYNPDTGVPYQATENVKAYRIVGTSIEVDQPEHYSDYESDEGWFLGVEICKTGSNRSNENASEIPAPTDSQMDKVKAMLAEVGCDLSPKLYVYTYLSY